MDTMMIMPSVVEGVVEVLADPLLVLPPHYPLVLMQ
jgi:hypothetical protein